MVNFMMKIEPTMGNREIIVNDEALTRAYKKFTLKELGKDFDNFMPSNSSSAQEAIQC